MRGTIWWFAFGYFASYVPYSALTKLLSLGSIGGSGSVSGFRILPASAITSMIGMFLFLTIARWWRFAGTRRIGRWDLPVPGRWTFLSGVMTAAIILTTTLAYAVPGASIVLMMLLMRGGVLVAAPIVDAFAHRRVRTAAWIALALSLGALALGIEPDRGGLPPAALLITAIYVGAYFVRLSFMSRLAKSDDGATNRRYFVEEQMVATPAAVAAIVIAALIGEGRLGAELRIGLADLAGSPALPVLVAVGLFSQGTGIFGGLVLLSKEENSFCVPVNRASSVLAGISATAVLALAGRQDGGSTGKELAAAAILAIALAVLAMPSRRSVARTGHT